MAKIKVIVEGQSKEIEIEGDLDYKSMGVMSQDEVTEFKKRAITEGFNKGKAEAEAGIESLTVKAADYEKKYNDLLGNQTGDKQQLETLAQTVTSLKEQMELAQKAKLEAENLNMINQALDGRNLIEGARDVFTLQAKAKQVEGGYMLADGTTGDLKAFSESYFNSDLGKRLTLTDQKGGNGTPPPNGFTPSKKLSEMNLEEKTAYKKQVGDEVFFQQVTQEGK